MNEVSPDPRDPMTWIRESVDDLGAYLSTWTSRTVTAGVALAAATQAVKRIDVTQQRLDRLRAQLVDETQAGQLGTAWERHDDPTLTDESGEVVDPDGPAAAHEAYLARLDRAATPASHQPWCTDHVADDPNDQLTEGSDECGAVVIAVPASEGPTGRRWDDLAVTASQAAGQAEPSVSVDSFGQPLTVEQARQLHASLGSLLDRIEGR